MQRNNFHFSFLDRQSNVLIPSQAEAFPTNDAEIDVSHEQPLLINDSEEAVAGPSVTVEEQEQDDPASPSFNTDDAILSKTSLGVNSTALNFSCALSITVAQPISLWVNTKDEVKDLLNSLRPFSDEEWNGMGWVAKSVGIAQVIYIHRQINGITH